MDILSGIVDYKKSVIASAKKNFPIEKMNLTGKTKGFTNSIKHKHENNNVSIIAEIKKGSPSKGLIVKDLNIATIAKEYEFGGASCVSVLTDEKFFFGSNANLKIAKENTNLPILRKDFIIDEYQIYESKHIGADAILLITSIIAGNELSHFEDIAFSLGLDVLIEVHNEIELDMAMKFTKSPLIGVNNRNLRDFSINIKNTENLIKKLSNDRIPVCESGIEHKNDIINLQEKGCNSFLIGTSLMQSSNRVEFLKKLIQ